MNTPDAQKAGQNPRSPTPGPIAIIGAGIVGVSTAIHLQRAGCDVVLIDRGEPGDGTSYGNGGVLASCSIVPVTVPGLLAKAPRMLLDPDQPLFLKWGYLPRLMPWLWRYLQHCKPEETRRIAAALAPIVGGALAEHRRLAAGTGAEKWIVEAPYGFVYRDRKHFEGDGFGWSIRRDNGYVWDEIEGPALRAAEPGLSSDLNFMARVHDHGRITDPGRYVKDLARYFVASGGKLIKADVEAIVQDKGRVTGVRAGGETLACRIVVVATGVWSGKLCKQLGLSVPLESERGYHVELIAPSMTPQATLMIASGKFVVTPMEGRLRLAGIVEFGGLDAPPSRAPFALLLRHVRRALPALTWRETREWMGHRPAPSDSIPVIGAVPGVEGAFVGFGHHHIGLTGGPKTGALLAQAITGRFPNLDLAPYSPMRFQ
jgi:D-amino-acid dehydrogenase